MSKRREEGREIPSAIGEVEVEREGKEKQKKSVDELEELVLPGKKGKKKDVVVAVERKRSKMRRTIVAAEVEGEREKVGEEEEGWSNSIEVVVQLPGSGEVPRETW